MIFPMTCRPTEDIRIYLWLVNKNAKQKATKKHAEKLLILAIILSISKNVIEWLVDDYLYHVWLVMLKNCVLSVNSPLNASLNIHNSRKFVCYAIFCFYKSFTVEKSISSTSLYSFLFWQNSHKVCLYFVVGFLFSHFWPAIKNVVIVHVFFVYFVGFIFVTKVSYLRMNTEDKSLSFVTNFEVM